MIKTLPQKNRLRVGAMTFIAAGGALCLAACASTPSDATLAIRAAEQAISTADKARVADVSSPELTEAREKYTAAVSAEKDDHMIEANRLALESRVDAELASAIFDKAKAQSVNDEIRKSTDMLSQEMQRNSGVKQ